MHDFGELRVNNLESLNVFSITEHWSVTYMSTLPTNMNMNFIITRERHRQSIGTSDSIAITGGQLTLLACVAFESRQWTFAQNIRLLKS